MFNAISIRNNDEFFQSLKGIQDINVVQQILRLYFQDIENCLAKASGRIPADVVIYSTPDDQGRTNPYYNFVKNELKIFYPNNSKPIEYLMALYHESAHADQNLAPSKTIEQQTLYKISQSLYVSPKHSKKRLHLGYRCNYKELEAKWNNILALKEEVSKKLELARAEKVIGHSLNAKVTIFANEKEHDFINENKDLLQTVFDKVIDLLTY